MLQRKKYHKVNDIKWSHVAWHTLTAQIHKPNINHWSRKKCLSCEICWTKSSKPILTDHVFDSCLRLLTVADCAVPVTARSTTEIFPPCHNDSTNTERCATYNEANTLPKNNISQDLCQNYAREFTHRGWTTFHGKCPLYNHDTLSIRICDALFTACYTLCMNAPLRLRSEACLSH